MGVHQLQHPAGAYKWQRQRLQKQLVKQKLIRASLTEERTGMNQHSLRAKNGRRTSRRRGHGTGAQVLTPDWAPSPQHANHSAPSGVCCKQAPPETSRMRRNHLPKEQLPGPSARGGEATTHIRHRSPSTPIRHSILKQSGALLRRGTPAPRAPCRREGTDARPPQASRSRFPREEVAGAGVFSSDSPLDRQPPTVELRSSGEDSTF